MGEIKLFVEFNQIFKSVKLNQTFSVISEPYLRTDCCIQWHHYDFQFMGAKFLREINVIIIHFYGKKVQI